MKSLTRRTFLKTSGMGTGLGLLVATSMSDALAQGDAGSGIISNFNGTPIRGGDFIWFNSVFNVKGLGSDPVAINFVSSIQFTDGGTTYSVPVPPAMVTFSPNVTVATTDFSSQWETKVPLSGLAGNVFLTGAFLQAPMPAGLSGGIKQLMWLGMFSSDTPGLEVQWKWAAAVYRNVNFGNDYNALGVKPVDDNDASLYQNSHHAGTPEYFLPYVVGGARGGGGSNFTGSYSGTRASVPCIPSLCGVGGS